MVLKVCEYIWIDGNMPVRQLRSKARVINLPNAPEVRDFAEWSFDGSSTHQATGENSDCLLKPVSFFDDPLANGGDYLILCEVLNPDGTTHRSNARASLRQVLDTNGVGAGHNPWIGFEQEYTMFKRNIPLGWPEHGYPAPQGPYYCGVGSEQIFGRELALEHMYACMRANLMYYGINAEVMPGQWEFQMGYRGLETEEAEALKVADHTWVARWLLHRISEKYNVHISLDAKPVKGDWNGAGMHANFSTKDMRDSKKGQEAIDRAVKALRMSHQEDVKYYGDKLEERLTGLHETSSINEFSCGNACRGSSIRIPLMVVNKGYGYLEDRRPAANADPYLVAEKLIASICLSGGEG